MFHVTSDNNVAQLFPGTTFRSSSEAASYYVVPIAESVRVPGVPAGSPATLRLRVWNSANGETYETATLRGESNDITVTLGGVLPNVPPLFDPVLSGLQGFTIVPEPSTISVALLGAVLLIGKRRRPSNSL